MAVVYISSTYKDLVEERQSAIKATQRLGHQVLAMENYVASSNRVAAKCITDVKSCDVYIGIFAWRYGEIPRGYKKSIAHMEYDAAKQIGIPRLIFLLDFKAFWPVEYVAIGSERQRIERLRKSFENEGIVSYFVNKDDLAAKVSAALSNQLGDFNNANPKRSSFFSEQSNHETNIDHQSNLNDTEFPSKSDFDETRTEGMEGTIDLGKMDIEITINRGFDDFIEEDQERLLRAIREFLNIEGELKIKKKHRGSVKLTFELHPDQAERLLLAIKSKKFEEHGVVDAQVKNLQTNELNQAKDFDPNAFLVEKESIPTYAFDYNYPLVSRSPDVKQLFSLIKKVAKSNASILIQGETGTGKELIAGLIQFISPRSDKPFIKVNCAALPEHLDESELFGHEKGAFPGAQQARIGKLEQAHGGTIFLDEIENMHLSTQTKLVRFLEEQTFTPLGGNRVIKVDVRVIAATSKDLWKEIQHNTFLADLYHRLNEVTLHIPPLRKRKEDILLIADFYRRKFSREIRKKTKGFAAKTIEILTNHFWPGNIRELKNLVERAVLVCEEGGEILPQDLSMAAKDYFAYRDTRRSTDGDVISLDTLNLEVIEKEAILRALELKDWNQKDAALLLGISHRALNYKIKHHNITHPKWVKN